MPSPLHQPTIHSPRYFRSTTTTYATCWERLLPTPLFPTNDSPALIVHHYRVVRKFIHQANTFHKTINSIHCRAIDRAHTTTINHNINTNQLNKACFTVKPTIHSLSQLCVTTVTQKILATTSSPPEPQPSPPNLKQLRTHIHANFAYLPDNLPFSTHLLSMTRHTPVVLLFTCSEHLLSNMYLPTIPYTTHSTRTPNNGQFPHITRSNIYVNQFQYILPSSSLGYSHHQQP